MDLPFKQTTYIKNKLCAVKFKSQKFKEEILKIKGYFQIKVYKNKQQRIKFYKILGLQL